MGANTSEAAITRAARSVTALQEISTNFNKETGVPVTSSAHSTLDTKDVNSAASVILKVFETQNGRMHSSFKNFSSNPLHNLDQEKILHWIATKQIQIIKYKYARMISLILKEVILKVMRTVTVMILKQKFYHSFKTIASKIYSLLNNLHAYTSQQSTGSCSPAQLEELASKYLKS
jgi:hypothetical protein